MSGVVKDCAINGLRKQRVKFKSGMSNSVYVNCGVPQGTVWGPVQFLLSVDDIKFY